MSRSLRLYCEMGSSLLRDLYSRNLLIFHISRLLELLGSKDFTTRFTIASYKEETPSNNNISACVVMEVWSLLWLGLWSNWIMPSRIQYIVRSTSNHYFKALFTHKNLVRITRRHHGGLCRKIKHEPMRYGAMVAEFKIIQ